VTILLVVTIGSSFLYELISQMVDPEYRSSHPETVFHGAYNVSYLDSMIAGRLLAEDSGAQVAQDVVNSYMRFKFKAFDDGNITNVDAINCLDLFKVEIEMEEQGKANTRYGKFWETIDDSPWICPNLTSIEL